MKWINRTNLAYILASSIATLAIVSGVWLVFFRQASALPTDISKQLTFTPFVVASDEMLGIQPNSYSYESGSQVLRFTIAGSDIGKLTISEQPTPPQFIDIQDYITKFTDSLNRYSAFDNEFGTVYLTRPKTLSNGQLALLNADGVLLLVQAYKNLSDDQWRQIFLHIKLDQ